MQLSLLYRVEVKKGENGKHQLILHNIVLADSGIIEARLILGTCILQQANIASEFLCCAVFRTPSNYGDEMISCTCSFNVAKGEEKPQMEPVGLVNGVANKACNWNVPYKVSKNAHVHHVRPTVTTIRFKVEGVLQSSLEVVVMKDGKELRIGQDVSVNLQGDSIGLSVINPKREKSGTYTVILRNAQGQDEKDIEVNIMGEGISKYMFVNIRKYVAKVYA